MPAKFRLKSYEENSFYHIFNRGVEKQAIFRDAQDFAVFLSYFKTYLQPKDIPELQNIIANPEASWRDKDNAIKLLRLNNFNNSLTLIAYCLMDNHFHLLVRQTDAMTIDRFMNSLCTRYTMYKNKKYKRVGPSFQGVYKAVLVESDDQLLYLTRYIHRNPISNRRFRNLASPASGGRSWEYSSYLDYLGERKTAWVKPKEILSYFSKFGFNSYQSFVEGTDESEREQIVAGKLLIDSEET